MRMKRLKRWWKTWREGKLGLDYIESLDANYDRINDELTSARQAWLYAKREIDRLNAELDQANERIEELETKLNRLGQRFDGAQTHIEVLECEIETLRGVNGKLKAVLLRIEMQQDAQRNSMQEVQNALNAGYTLLANKTNGQYAKAEQEASYAK